MEHTLARLTIGPFKGVPSRFSVTATLAFTTPGTDPSRITGLVKSAYFRQLSPQSSHRMLLDRPLGAFHHCVDSRLLQEAHMTLLRGCFTMEPSSSEHAVGDSMADNFPEARSWRSWMFCSPSFELFTVSGVTRSEEGMVSLPLPVAVVSDDFVYRPSANFFAYMP